MTVGIDSVSLDFSKPRCHKFIKEVSRLRFNDLVDYGWIFMGDLRLSGSIIRKSRFIFTKERRIIRQKSGCLNH